MQTVVARFHHLSREPAEIERGLVEHGAKAALITGYTVVLTLDADSHSAAAKRARQVLDDIGATRIKVTKRGAKHAAAA